MVVAVMLMMCGISVYAWFNQTKKVSDNNQLVVGIAAGYAPFVSINAQGMYEGFDIDVAQALAKKMGKTLVLKDLGSMISLFVALDQGSIDCIAWGLSITQDRLRKVAMVHYQGDSIKSYPLIFWNNIPEKIKSINDMNSRVVCVETGSAQEKALRKYGQITIMPLEKVDDALLNIQYGKANAAFVEPAIAKKFKNKFPEIQNLDVELDSQDYVQGIGIVIKKDNDELIKNIQESIIYLKNDGTIKELEKKWGIEE